mgnify:CR=1 FL=1
MCVMLCCVVIAMLLVLMIYGVAVFVCVAVRSVASEVSAFLFQAEDGIRYLVRSRGLGDVYKRQPHHRERRVRCVPENPQRDVAGRDRAPQLQFRKTPVSYTHLTLPTSDLV